MLVKNLKIESIEPNEIQLKWENPNLITFKETIIVKKAKEYPARIADGETVYTGVGTKWIDKNAIPMELCYYTVFCKDALNNYDSSALTKGYCLCTKDWKLTEYVYDSFPELYRGSDEKTKDLKKFIDVVAGLFNSIFSNIVYLKSIYNIDYIDDYILNKLGNSLGYKLNDEFSVNFRRRELQNILNVYKLKGTKLGLDFLIEEISQWNYSIKEMFDNIFYIGNSNCKISEINNMTKGFVDDTSRYIYGNPYSYNNVQIFIKSDIATEQQLLALTIDKIKTLLAWWLPICRTYDLIEIKTLIENNKFTYQDKFINDINKSYSDSWYSFDILLNESFAISNANYTISTPNDIIARHTKTAVDKYYDIDALIKKYKGVSDRNYLISKAVTEPDSLTISELLPYEYKDIIWIDGIGSVYDLFKSLIDTVIVITSDNYQFDTSKQITEQWSGFNKQHDFQICNNIISNNTHKLFPSYYNAVDKYYDIDALIKKYKGVSDRNYLISKAVTEPDSLTISELLLYDSRETLQLNGIGTINDKFNSIADTGILTVSDNLFFDKYDSSKETIERWGGIDQYTFRTGSTIISNNSYKIFPSYYNAVDKYYDIDAMMKKYRGISDNGYLISKAVTEPDSLTISELLPYEYQYVIQI